MGNRDHLFLAVDLGASHGRVTLGRLGDRQLVLREAHRFAHAAVERDGALVWDWPLIVRETRRGLATACEMAEGAPILSVSCDAWAQDFGLLNADGNLVAPPVSYRDKRTEGMPGRFDNLVSSEELRTRVGGPPSPVTALCQLRAMVERGDEALDSASTLLPIADLLHFELCGVAATDRTLASASQMLNLCTNDWDCELLRKLGIPHAFLPRIAKGPSVLATIPDKRAPHPALVGVRVITGTGHDTATATVAVSPMEVGTLFASLGTWRMVGCRVEEPVAPADEGLALMGIADDGWGVFSGGTGFWIVQECRRLWDEQGQAFTYEQLNESAARSACEAAIDPDDPRFFAPGNMVEEVRQACREGGQPLPREPGDVVRVVLRGLAKAVGEGVRQLASATGFRFERLHAVNGGSQNFLLCQRIADDLGLPVHAGPPEASTVGNLLLQAQALGVLNHPDETREILRGSFPERVFQPAPR